MSLSHPVKVFVNENKDIAFNLQQEFIRVRPHMEADREAIVAGNLNYMHCPDLVDFSEETGSQSVDEFISMKTAACGSQGCHDRPDPFVGQTSCKATKPSLDFYVLFYNIFRCIGACLLLLCLGLVFFQ